MMAKRSLRLALPWLAIAVVGALAAWLRFRLVESPALAHLCESGTPPAWCGLRQFVVLGFNSYGYGVLALVLTLLALTWKRAGAAALAAALGLFALILYCPDAGAVALLTGCLRLLHLQARMPAPRGEHGHGDRHVQAQP